MSAAVVAPVNHSDARKIDVGLGRQSHFFFNKIDIEGWRLPIPDFSRLRQWFGL